MRTRLISVLVLVIVLAGCRKSHPGMAVQLPPEAPPEEDTLILRPPPVEPEVPPAYQQEAVHRDIGANVGGFYEALPPGYDSSEAAYPLIVFLHGGGELGDGNKDLPLVLKNAIPKRIREQTFPLSFAVGDSTFSFVVISPQFKEWPQPNDVEAVVNYALENYRINQHRVYMVGLSMGGGATWKYAADHGRRLAAIVPICGAVWSDTADAKRIAHADLPVWAFHNMDDAAVPVRSTTRYMEFMNAEGTTIPPRVTLWPTGGHDAWTKATDPSYKEDDKNIYEWMLQYVR